MRRLLLTAGIFAATVAGNTGCSTMNNTEKGVGIGAALGAGTGALIGSASGNPKTGAVIGGLLGGGVGGLVGNDVDKQEAREATARHDRAAIQYSDAQPQRLEEVVRLTKGGQGEQVILNHIRSNGMRFNLSVADLDYLKQNGVSDRVIAEMQTGGSVPVTRIRTAPPVQTVVVQEQVVVPAYGYGYGGPYYGPYYGRPRPAVGATFIVR